MIMHMVCTLSFLIWFSTGWFYPYPSWLLHWHWGDLIPSASKPWWIHIYNKLRETIKHWWYNPNKTKHNQTMCIFQGISCSMLTDKPIPLLWLPRNCHQILLMSRKSCEEAMQLPGFNSGQKTGSRGFYSAGFNCFTQNWNGTEC